MAVKLLGSNVVYVPRRERIHPVVVRELRNNKIEETAEGVASLVVRRQT